MLLIIKLHVINVNTTWARQQKVFDMKLFFLQNFKWIPHILNGECGRVECFYLILMAPLKAIALMPLSLASTYPLIFPDQNTKRSTDLASSLYLAENNDRTLAPILMFHKTQPY